MTIFTGAPGEYSGMSEDDTDTDTDSWDDPQARAESDAEAARWREYSDEKAADRYIYPLWSDCDESDEDEWSEECSDWDYSQTSSDEEWRHEEQKNEGSVEHNEHTAFNAQEESDSESQSATSDVMPRRSHRPARVLPIHTRTRLNESRLSGKNPLHRLPEEIIHMIFSDLEPSDLLNVARTSKTYWESLTKTSLSSLWKLFRERSKFYGSLVIPPPPLGVSEIRWTALLCDNMRCWECHSKHKRGHLLVTMVRRLCTHCLKKLTIRVRTDKEFREHFPSYDEDLVELLPLKNARSLSKLGATYCLPSDVEALARRYNAFRKQDSFGAFLSSQREMAASLLEAARLLLTWDNDAQIASARCRLQETAACMRRKYAEDDAKTIDSVLARFDRVIERDLHLDRSDRIRYDTGEERMCARFKESVKCAITERKARRRDSIILRRASLAETLYGHMGGLSPLSLHTLPSLLDMALPQAFLDVVRRTDGPDVAEQDAEELSAVFPLLLDAAHAWASENRAELERLGPASRDVDDASAVFICRCRVGNPLLGTGEALSHRCPASRTFQGQESRITLPGWVREGVSFRRRVEYTVKGSAALAQVRELVGGAELDTRNARFVCMACPSGGRTEGRPAFRWRQSVYHHAMAGDDHEAPRFQLLDAGQEMHIKAQERNPGACCHNSENWACALCRVHLSAQVTYAHVQDHVKNEHSIENPQEYEHFFWFPGRTKSTGGEAVWLPMAPHLEVTRPGWEWRCLVCASTIPIPNGARRLFNQSGIRLHIKSRHAVQPPNQEQGIHFARVES